MQNEKKELLNEAVSEINNIIDNYVHNAMEKAANNNLFDLPTITSFLPCSLDMLENGEKSCSLYLKEKVVRFLKLLLVTEMVFMQDCENGNLADYEKSILLYYDLKQGIKDAIDSKLINPSATKDANKGKTLRRILNDLKDTILKYDFTLLKNKDDELKVDAEITEKKLKYVDDPLLEIIHYSYDREFSKEFFNNSIAFLNLNLDEYKDVVPVSFFPYYGFTSEKFSTKKFLFTQISNYLKKYKDYKTQKDDERNFGYLVNTYNEYGHELDELLAAGKNSHPEVLAANSFMFEAFLHRDFFGSLNCQLFNTISEKIDIVRLQTTTRRMYEASPYYYISTDESLFYLRLLELLMTFDINLKELHKLPIYEKCITITSVDKSKRNRMTLEEFRNMGSFMDFPSGKEEVDMSVASKSSMRKIHASTEFSCIDNSIAFSYSMKFIYSFLRDVHSNLAKPINDAINFIKKKYEPELQQEIIGDLISGVKSSSVKEMNPLFEKRQFIIIAYLLNKGSENNLFKI